jgi:hypothetical protein
MQIRCRRQADTPAIYAAAILHILKRRLSPITPGATVSLRRDALSAAPREAARVRGAMAPRIRGRRETRASSRWIRYC